MKPQSILKRALLSVLLTLTLTCTLLSVSASDTDDEAEPIKDPAAKLTVTSVKTGETTETLYEIAEGAFYAADQAAKSPDTTVTVTMLAPAAGFTFECAIGDAASPITVDLGGFRHYIKHLSVTGEGMLTIKNGTLFTSGSYTQSPSGIIIINPAATVVLEKDVTVIGADRSTVIQADGTADVTVERKGTTPLLLRNGTLINHGTIVGGTGAHAVLNDGGEIYNHGTIQGGNGTTDNPASTFDAGAGIDGYAGVKLNTGVIRGGDFTSEVYEESMLMCAPAVYGIVGENRGEIIGGSIKANSHSVNAGPGVYGAVGINTGTIRGGDAHSYAEQGSVFAAAGVVGWQVLGAADYGYDVDYYHDEESPIEAVVIDNQGTITNGQASADRDTVTVSHANTILSRSAGSYEVLYNSGTIPAHGGVYAIDDTPPGLVVYQNTGTISPVSFEQAYLTVYMDGEAITADTLYPFYDGKERTITYALMFGRKEVPFEGVTHTLTLNDSETVDVLLKAGKYTLTVTYGEESKEYALSIRPAHPFIDITDDHPYYSDIAGVYQKSLMNGVEPNVFSPDETLTRAMLVTMLWRMEGCPYVNYAMQFTDVSQEEWYSEAIRWAASEGIVLGREDGTFGTDDPITLEQLSVILYRYEQYKGGGFVGMWMFRLNYEDIADISDWAYEAICYMTMKGIYCLPSETTLEPKKEATRAEAAVFLNRYAEFCAAKEASNENP